VRGFEINRPTPAAIKRLTVTTAAALTRIVPSNTAIGGSAFRLTVNGDHFVKTSTVSWNGSPRATTFVSETQLTAQILSSDIANPGETNVGCRTHPRAAAPPRRNHSRFNRLWDLIS
jgi:trimeric autotransporter adhesin